MKETSSAKKEETVDSSNVNPNTKSPSDSKSYSRSRSRSHSGSKSKSKSKSPSKSSKNSRKSSEEKYPVKNPKKQKESKERQSGDDDKNRPGGAAPNFPNFMNPQPFNPKHFPLGQMQGGLFGAPYGGPFLPMTPLHFPNFYRSPQPPGLYYKGGYGKKFNPEDGDKNSTNNLLQNLGVPMPLKPMGFRKGGPVLKNMKKKNDDAPIKTKKTIEDVLVFKKFSSLPLTTEIFLTVQAFLQYADQNLYMNMSKKLLADFEKKCKDNKMKNLAKSLGRYLINFNEMIKKEKEKELKETKETKKKVVKEGKNTTSTEEKDSEIANKIKDFEVIQWLHKNKNVQDLFNKVNLDSFKLDEFNFNTSEKCVESKNIFEETKELFLKKFK